MEPVAPTPSPDPALAANPPATSAQPEEHATAEGSLEGRCCSRIHLPQGCALSSLLCKVAVTVIGIAGVIFFKDSSLPATAISGTTAAASGISVGIDIYTTIKLFAWEPRHTLEEAARSTEESTRELKLQVHNLTSQITLLETTKNELETALSQEQTRTESLTKRIENHQRELTAIQTALQDLQNTLDQTAGLKEVWQRLASTVSEEMVTFHNAVRSFLEQDVSSHIQAIDRVASVTQTETVTVQQLLDKIFETKSGWGVSIKKLSTRLTDLRLLVGQKERQLSDLRRKLEELSKLNTSLNESSIQYQTVSEELKTIIARFETDHKAQLRSLLPILQSLTKINRATPLEEIKRVGERGAEILESLLVT